VLLTRSYQHNSEALTALSNLKLAPAQLRDKIFEAYIQNRFQHEQSRADAELAFSVESIYETLGRCVMDTVDYIDAGETLVGVHLREAILRRLGKQYATFVEQLIRLNILVWKTPNELDFIHKLLRDHFGLRFALKFQEGPMFAQATEGFRSRTLQYLAQSNDERALSPLLAHVFPYIDFPLVYSLHFYDSQVLLGYARSLVIDKGDPKYDYVSDAAMESIKIVCKGLGERESARILTAAASSISDHRAEYVFAVGFLELAEGFDRAVQAAKDDDPTVRACAVYALAAIGDPRGAEAVKRLLSDEQEPRSWERAPWRTGSRVKDIALAALGREINNSIRDYAVPLALSKALVAP
jgi:hypothetical protein